MASKFSRGPWTVKFNKRRGWWEVHNGRRDPIAIIYSGRVDAELMSTGLRLLGSLKHLIAIVRMHEGELRASAKAKLAQAQALVDELNGDKA